MQRFAIEQKITMLANQYWIYRADESGAKQEPVGFAHQKRLAFREKFEVYTDSDKSEILFTVQARSVLDMGARYDVCDAKGERIGTLGKSFKSSLLRSTWQIFAPGHEDQPLVLAQERSQALAVIRRIWDFIPVLGDIPFFVKYHFDLVDAASQAVVGGVEKTTLFRDHYLLSADDALLERVDWRTLVALGVMLDALQRR
jgi:uncharacterized protein YxjI